MLVTVSVLRAKDVALVDDIMSMLFEFFMELVIQDSFMLLLVLLVVEKQSPCDDTLVELLTDELCTTSINCIKVTLIIPV